MIEQYQTRWKDLRERLNKKLEETSKLYQIFFSIKTQDFLLLELIRSQIKHFTQDSDVHLKKCSNFITTLIEIQKDSTRTSKNKLEQLRVKLYLFFF